MLRGVVLSVVLITAIGCVSAPPAPTNWYVLSPPATINYPHGNLNSNLSKWVKVKDFPSEDACQDQLRDIHNQLHRPVDCVASNDPRLAQW
jgi:hypothetical protein